MQELKCLLIMAVVNTNAIASRNAREDSNSYGPPSSEGTPSSAPYPPSGWAPSGQLLLHPGETHSSQNIASYGPPPALPPKYSPPPTTTTESVITTTEAISDVETSQDADENGQYYVLLANGKVQKVQYSGKQKGRGQYEAQVQYEEVEQIRPLNSFDPRGSLQYTF